MLFINTTAVVYYIYIYVLWRAYDGRVHSPHSDSSRIQQWAQSRDVRSSTNTRKSIARNRLLSTRPTLYLSFVYSALNKLMLTTRLFYFSHRFAMEPPVKLRSRRVSFLSIWYHCTRSCYWYYCCESRTVHPATAIQYTYLRQ